VSRHEQPRLGYQGERLHLRVNRLAAGELGELLDYAATDPSQAPIVRQASLVLPDGRRLEVSVQVTDDGAVYNDHGEYVTDDGQPHADLSGDFAVHVAASRVMAAATGGYRQAWAPDAAATVDVNHIRQALDEHLAGDVHPAVRDRIADRAMVAADKTRAQRLADAQRRVQRRERNGVAGRGEHVRGGRCDRRV
jgi:hypothetical protein